MSTHSGTPASSTRAATRLHLRLLPLSVAVILASTAVPIEAPGPPRQGFWPGVEVGDALLNIALYVPLGVAAAGLGVWRCAGLALLLSLPIELLQMFFPQRFPSLWDVAANVGGVLLGLAVARRLRPRFGPLDEIRLGPGGVAALLAGGAVLLGLVSFGEAQTDFSNWDPACKLAIGDELTRDRTWHGRIAEMAILSYALDARTVRGVARSDPAWPEVLRERRLPLPLYRIAPPADPERLYGRPLLDVPGTSLLFDRLVASGELTLLVRLRSEDLTQQGPARIVTFSRDTQHRNFTLAQHRRHLVFRLRTPSTGPNGMEPQLVSHALLAKGREYFVAVTFDGAIVRLYLDGSLVDRLNLKASRRLFPFLSHSGLPTVAVTVAMFAAVGALWSWSPRRRWVRWTLGGSAGLLGTALLMASGGLGTLPGFTPVALVLGLGSGLVVAVGSTTESGARGGRAG